MVHQEKNHQDKKAAPAHTAAHGHTAVHHATHQHPASEAVDIAQKAHEQVLDISRAGATHMMQTTESLTRSADECSHALGALMESGKTASAVCQDIGTEVAHYTNRAFSDYEKISQELSACRSIADMVVLQNKIMQHVIADCLEETSKLWKIVFNRYHEALAPIEEHRDSVTRRGHKMSAA